MAGEQPSEDADQQLLREYDSLQTLDQKLVHQNWKIRKMAYFEMGQLFLNTHPQRLEEDAPNPYEVYFTWLKGMMGDKNMTA